MNCIRIIFCTLFLLATLLLSVTAQAAGTLSVTYYHNDATGSPVAATNQQGQVVWRKVYTPYGEASGRDRDNRIGYTGHVEDANGLIYAGARYYDPMLGRFLSTDSVGFTEKNLMSFNRYAYANDNPYKYVDPDGREIQLAANVSNEFKAQYAAAVAHMNAVDPNNILNQLIARTDVTVTLAESSSETKYDPANDALSTPSTITWEAYAGMDTPDGKVQSPAVGLLHEAAHAMGDITGTGASTKDIPGFRYNTLEEKRVIEGYEVPMARKLGEGIRHDHQNNKHIVGCSTCIK